MSQEQKSSGEVWLESMRASGYRLTTPRRVIVNIIANSGYALEAIEIFDLSRDEYPRLGLVTVYRTLEKLEQLGLVQRVHQPDGCHLYLRAPKGHEHILLCKSCRRTDYFRGDDLSELIEETSQSSGFEIEDHWLQFFGVCKTCQQANHVE